MRRVGLRQRAHLARAFTLIELMIVVAIVGILAVLGVVGYRKLILAAHTSEATHMVQSIRVAQEAYHAEAQTYVSTTPAPDGIGNLFPTISVGQSLPGAYKAAWSTPTPPTTAGSCQGTTGKWQCFGLLPVHPDGPVMYGYATFSGIAGTDPGSVTLPSITLTGPGAAVTTDWFWITATGNPDAANSPPQSLWSYVVGNSLSNDLYVQDP